MHYAISYLVGIFSEGKISSKKKYLVNTAVISRNISLIVIVMNQRKFLDIPRYAQEKMRLQISICISLIKRSKKQDFKKSKTASQNLF